MTLPETAARRYAGGECSAPGGLPRPPLASFGHGAAGVAYFLLRYAALADDPLARTAAAQWIARARQDLDHSGAFVTRAKSPALPRHRDPPPPSSLYFGEAGVWCVAALAAAALNDPAGVERAVGRFAAVAEACPLSALDAINGAPFLLLGAALLVEQLDDASAARLQPSAERLEGRLKKAAAAHGRTGSAPPLERLGAAHGSCGMAHALLRWCQATGTEPGPELLHLLDHLRAARLPSGLWPKTEAAPEDVLAGWCNGSAGWVQLWTLAHEVLGDPRILVLAGPPAAHAVAGGRAAGLCCGLVGQAYAALELHRVTRHPGWLGHARHLAAIAADEPLGEDFPAHSLWRGDLGVALLALELREPQRACMPLYRRLR